MTNRPIRKYTIWSKTDDWGWCAKDEITGMQVEELTSDRALEAIEKKVWKKEEEDMIEDVMQSLEQGRVLFTAAGAVYQVHQDSHDYNVTTGLDSGDFLIHCSKDIDKSACVSSDHKHYDKINQVYKELGDKIGQTIEPGEAFTVTYPNRNWFTRLRWKLFKK